jgi:hypothetical protein
MFLDRWVVRTLIITSLFFFSTPVDIMHNLHEHILYNLWHNLDVDVEFNVYHTHYKCGMVVRT